MRIFLTGAAGYIGLHAVRALLADGHEVTALVRTPAKLGPYMQDPRLRVVQADLEETERVAQALAGHAVCVHAALIWGEPGSEFELRDTAVAAKLFDAAGQAGAARCIYLSSAAVHRPFSGEMREDDRLTTTDVYGATKAAGELFLRAACATYGMTGIVLRPGPVVGAPAFPGASFHADNRLSALVGAALAGRPLEVVAGEGRQFTDVAPLARAIATLGAVAEPQSTYLCVDHDILTWEWIARTVVACLGSASEVRALPAEAAQPAARFDTARFERLVGGTGGTGDVRAAMLAHIRHLADNWQASKEET